MKRLAIIPVLVSLAFFVATVSAATVIVTGNTTAVENTPGGWMFNRDLSTSSPYEFTNAKADIGVGSLFVKPITNTLNGNSDKFIAEHFLQVPIASMNSFSFDFLLGAGGPANAYQHFYMSVYAIFGGSSPTKFYDCRYDIVATSGSTAAWTTVTFNPALSYSVVTRGGATPSPFPCPASPAAMNAISPGSSIRAISINVGDTSGSDTGVSGYLDKVVVNLTGGSTTFDFEPYVVATDKDQCKDGGWQTLKRADGSAFKNQRDCVSYTNNGR